jgi:hypothetical protein
LISSLVVLNTSLLRCVLDQTDTGEMIRGRSFLTEFTDKYDNSRVKRLGCMGRFDSWPFQPTAIASTARENSMHPEVADFVHFLEITPGALNEFLECHAADNRWPWQRIYWWCHLQIFLIRTEILGE